MHYSPQPGPEPLNDEVRYLLATTNAGKQREIWPLLADLGIELIGLGDLPPIPAPDETGATFAENARLKALAYAAASGLPTIAEDSGLVIAALGGEPGIYSARWLGPHVSYPQRFAEIERRLRGLPKAERDARFVAAVAVAIADRILFETEAATDGLIAPEPAGDGGFGYDPIFFYAPFGRTTAQLTPEEKQAVSHRGRAFRDLARWLRRRGA